MFELARAPADWRMGAVLVAADGREVHVGLGGRYHAPSRYAAK
jgi:hypothetical protein